MRTSDKKRHNFTADADIFTLLKINAQKNDRNLLNLVDELFHHYNEAVADREWSIHCLDTGLRNDEGEIPAREDAAGSPSKAMVSGWTWALGTLGPLTRKHPFTAI